MPERDEQISALYQKSRDRLQPPGELDDAIRAEARRQGRRVRWLSMPAVGAAATLLIGVGLAWLYIGVPPQLLQEPALEDAPSADLRTEPSPVPTPSDAPTPPPAPRSPRLELAAPAMEAVLEEDRTDAARRSKAPTEVRREFGSAGVAVDQGVRRICDHDLANAPGPAWREAIAGARETGDMETAECLAAAFRERFGEDAAIE